MKLSVDLPAELLLQTNLPIPKLVGFVNYSDLSVTELKPPHYFLPSHLQSRLKTVSQNGSTLTHFHSPKFRFSGEWLYSRNSGEKTEQMFMERILALPRALPEMKILNPPYEAGMGINLFEISESELVRQAGQNWNLLSTVRVKLGTYQKVAELPLRVGAEVSQSGWSPGCPKPVHDHN